jgi:putative membrane protein
MYVKRRLSFAILYFYTWRIALMALITGLSAIFIYDYLGWEWAAIPWLPISLIGIATAFYVGFKNSQSYDRSWEARKIWGAITNLSRSYASTLRAFVNNDFTADDVPQEQIDKEIKALLYRHMGWLYTLKHAMAQRTSWEHSSVAARRQRKALHTHEHDFETEIKEFLSEEEQAWLKTKRNGAAQLLDVQSQHMARLRKEGLIDDFRHVELQKIIKELYDEQGKTERIKNTPFPRQYATISTLFIAIFVILLPFGMILEFKKLGDGMQWLLVPFNLVVSWVFTLMEYTGDVSENPFEGLLNDVPLRSIVRNIEIDIKDMLGEEDLPPRVEPIYGALF